MNKPWLKSYPSMVEHEIGELPARSIGELLRKSCAEYGDRPAFTCMGSTISFAEVRENADLLGAYLQSLDLERGARVAVMLPNVPQYPVALLGVLSAGYVLVNVNPQYTARELEHQLNDSGAEAIIVLENFAHVVQKCIGKTKVRHTIVASLGDMMGIKGHLVNFAVRKVRKMVPDFDLKGHVTFKDALKKGKSLSFKPADNAPDDVAILQYTGGTTGVSKGATLLHRNILANVAQFSLWEKAGFPDGRPDDLVYVCALPLYHIYALTVNCLIGMKNGVHNILIPNPRDMDAFVKALKGHKFNVFPGLNTLFVGLMNNEEFRKLDFSSLRITGGGGMAVQKPVAERWEKLTGVPIAEGYGLSETSPVATANRYDAPRLGTIGLPIPSTEVAIRDEDGNDLGFGEPGEICIRGPQVMAGYWNRPEETAKVMTPDGYFRSGDIGMMDEDGYVTIVDRKKDMILVSGFNVYPNEIEEVAVGMDGIVEAAAVAVPDEHSGEVPKLYVVKSDPSITEDQVLAHCKQNLTGYKRPKHVEFRDELPKSNVGKILRKQLRDN